MAEAVEAVLFDLDGTLIGTRSLYLEAYRRAVTPFVRKDLTHSDIRALKPTSELGFLREIVTAESFDACLESFYTCYRDLHDELFEGVYEGIPELLDAVRGAGLGLGIVTGKSRRSWEITSAIVALGPFDILVFDDDVRAPKPDPHGLELAVEHIGADPARAVYVGDTISDVKAARAAGLTPISALWSRRPDDRPAMEARAREEGALVVDRPAGVRRALGI